MDIVLVHGTTQSPAGWQHLSEVLTARGHRCHTVDLESSVDIDAAGYAARVQGQLPTMTHPIVVAHSGSGLLLPAIARAVKAGMQVFVAAWIPNGANSLMDELSAGPERIFHSDWLGQDPVTDPDVARSFLFHDCSAEVADWATTTLRTFYPAKVYTEVVQPAAECRSAAIVPLGDRTLRWEWMAEAARDRLGVEPHMIPGGHCPHVSRPDQLAELIERVADT